MRAALLVGGVLAAMAGATAQNQSIFQKAPADVEEKLRARVTAFYSLYMQGKFRQAEQFVAEESRDLYYAMQKAPIRSFQVEQITWDDKFENATVLVACLSATPRTASQGIWVPINGKWKVQNGEWYLVIQPRTGTPFGPMHFDNPLNTKPQPFERPTLEMLRKGAVQVEPQKLVFPAASSEAVVRKFTIRNTLPGVIYVTLGDPRTPGLKAILADPNILPEKEAVVEVTYDPKAASIKAGEAKELRVLIQPLNQEVAVALQFE